MDSNEEKKDDLEEKEVSLEPKEEKKEEVKIAVKEEPQKAIAEQVKEEKEDEQESKELEVKQKGMTNKKKKIILIAAISVFILLALFSTVFALINIGNDKIISGITIKGIDVSGLTKEEATQKIREAVEIELGKVVLIKKDDYENTISPEQIEAKYDIERAVDEAYSIGRLQNIVANNYSILSTKLFKKDIEPNFSYNDEVFQNIIADIATKIPGSVVESDYYLEDETLVITKGKEGDSVKQEELKSQILNAIQQEDDNTIQIPVEEIQPEEIDIQKIHDEIYKEAKDAYYTKNPFKIYPHVEGVDFAISMDEAKAMLAEEKDQYEIPLKITKPKITTDKLGDEAFPDLLGSFTTKYDASNSNRTTNLQLASNKINGTVIMPGETFSYNKVVGKRTIAAGYKEAAIYENGEVVDGLGGGICQISSTLYNAVVYANLEVTSRSNHQFVPSYVTASRDATVVYGAIDFKFKNTRNYPIKVVSSVKSGIAKISIYGIKEETEYEVVIESNVTETIPYTTKYVETLSLPAGKEQVVKKGSNGSKSQAYKVLKLNGKVVSRTLLSKDSYSAMQRVVNRGTAATPEPDLMPVPEPTPTPEPTPDPEPTPTPEPTPEPDPTQNTVQE